jgi:Kef-type K+ transport system membrane component KefB
MNATLPQLLLQIVLILTAARICGLLLRLLGQPQVIGEMAAGILLGPSLLGRFENGQLLEALFPAASRPNLELFAHLGIILFMFLVGLEVDVSRIRQQGKAVLHTGIASMAIPFLFGLAVAFGLVRAGYGAGDGGTRLGFVLFIATAFSITAFPVLARILTEANMLRTRVGTVAIACAALNDIAGWCLLGAVFALARGAESGAATDIAWNALATLGLAGAYLAAMVLLIRPVLRRLQALFDARGYLSADVLAVLFILLTFSSLITDRIGIHALFGAFMLGAMMPSEERFVAHLTAKLEDLVTLLLLPLFFAYTGLQTNLGLIASPRMWAIAGLITAAATVGKLGGTAIAASLGKMSPRESIALGVLMNTRGLMELVILNLALELHAITADVFSMMVMMTLVTTAMTAPLLRLLYPPARRRAELLAAAGAAEPAPEDPGTRVVLAVARPATVPGLVRAAAMLLGRRTGSLWALHVDRAEDHEHREEQADPLALAQQTAKDLDSPMQTVSLISDRFADSILELAQRRAAAWIVLGFHKPVFNSSLLGGTTGRVMNEAAASVAVLVDKGLVDVKRVLVPYMGHPQDIGALLAAEQLARWPGVEVTILHLVTPERRGSQPLGVSGLLEKQFPGDGNQTIRMQVIETKSPIDKVVEESYRYDLMVLGLSPTWRESDAWLTAKQEWVAQQSQCSVLLTRAGKTATPSAAPASAAPALAPSPP